MVLNQLGEVVFFHSESPFLDDGHVLLTVVYIGRVASETVFAAGPYDFIGLKIGQIRSLKCSL